MIDEFPDEKTFWEEITRDAPDLKDLSTREKFAQLFMMRRLYVAMSADGITPQIWNFLESNEQMRRAVGHLLRHIFLICQTHDQPTAEKMVQQVMRDVSQRTHDIRFHMPEY